MRQYTNNQGKPKPEQSKVRYRRIHNVILLTAVMVSTFLAAKSTQTEASSGPALTAPVALAYLGNKNRNTLETAAYDKNSLHKKQSATKYLDATWKTLTVKPGYDLKKIGTLANANPNDIKAILALEEPAIYLRNLYPGDKIGLRMLPTGKVIAMKYDIHDSKRLLIDKTNVDGLATFKTSLVNRPLKVQTVKKTGVIQSSLFKTARELGLSKPMTLELATIFDWDIDFSRDVKKGDRFTLIFEEHYRGGEKISDSPILAAEFINNGKRYRAIRYTAENGKAEYYRPDGISIRKPFLRNPVDYPLVSSKFDLNRKHPILSKIRAHRGVDYAAKKGTPIKATGDGMIVFRGKKGGYGNTIIIQHGERYSTLYAHMSRYAIQTQAGRRVRQGQVIGYVGKSGLATGSHLHYEFRIDGAHHDPLAIRHSHKIIDEKRKQDFIAYAQRLTAKLDRTEIPQLALNYTER